MTRLADSDFNGSAPGDATLVGSPTYDTTTPIEGDASLVCNAASEYARLDFAGVSGDHYYFRFLVRLGSIPASGLVVFQVMDGINPVGSNLNLASTGKLQLGATGTTVLQPGVVYTVEVRKRQSGGTVFEELRLNGAVEVAERTVASNWIPKSGRFGWPSSNAAGVVSTIDMLAVNDNQGASDNTWPGVLGEIKHRAGGAFALKPVKHKSGGAFASKTVKHKSGGVFV